MNIHPKLGQACLDAALAAANGKVSKSEIETAWRRLHNQKRKLDATGDVTNTAAKLVRYAVQQAERTRVAAAMQRKHAALNILVRDRLERQIDTMMAAGIRPDKALLAVLEGIKEGVYGGRDSVDALFGSYQSRFVGAIMAEIQAERPHLIRMLRDQKLDTDTMIEMAEIKPSGKPGVTGNPDAQFLAKVFHKYAELSRTELNRLGAAIGKLEGWSGVQTHDDLKMIAAGKENWINNIRPKLDIDRTFPDADGETEIREILGGMYDTIITGISDRPTAASRGQRVNPPNLAKSLGKSRVLHFIDAQAAIAYRNDFGHGNTISGLFDHQRRAARLASVMKKLGPNPEIMLNGMVDTLGRKVRDSTKLTPKEKEKQSQRLTIDGGKLRHALDIATGMASRPVAVTHAQVGASIRAGQTMAKLGGALISSISDTVTAGAAAQFRGSGFIRGFTAQLAGLRRGRTQGEFAEIAFLLGEGFDGVIGQITHPSAAIDGPPGYMSALTEKFFRWNGLSWWTDVQRATAGRVIAAEMGMRAKSSYGDLPDRYRHVLGLHSIDAAKWEAIRQVQGRTLNGRDYITPDRIRDLPDDVIEPLVQDRLDAARAAIGVDDAKTPETRAKREAEYEERRQKIVADGRTDLELSVLAFVADETTYGVIEVDARSRRTTTLGQRPGTVAGEVIRFVMQFKGFPTAFLQRVGGRAIYGHRDSAGFGEKAAHIGTLLAGMTMAGYASIVVKDMARGYWPPRDPSDPATIAAAFVQGGAAGIYGDFLFSKVNRFGGGLLETLAGPTFGSAGDLWNIYNDARDAALSGEKDMRMGDIVNFALQNTPYINLFYTRTALDYLFLNSLRELATPGYTRRTEQRRENDYGQERFYPEPLQPFQ